MGGAALAAHKAGFPEETCMFRRILVPTDGSAASMAAVDAAVGLAHRSHAQLFGLYVTPRRPALAGIVNLLIAPEHPDRSREFLGYLERRAAQAQVSASVQVRHADAAHEAIVATARELECDLVVMASHGRSPAQALLLGSQTQEVLAHSSIPVLVIPRPDSFAN